MLSNTSLRVVSQPMFNKLEIEMPRRKAAATTRPTASAAGAKVDLFKTKDIKEDVLINRVIAQAGVTNDAETTGFIKAVLPRFAETSPRQAFSSMSKMVREFGRGNTNVSNGSDGEKTANATTERRRPGRPPGSKNKTKPGGGSGSNDKGQAAGEKRRPGRPKGSKNRTRADRPQ